MSTPTECPTLTEVQLYPEDHAPVIQQLIDLAIEASESKEAEA